MSDEKFKQLEQLISERKIQKALDFCIQENMDAKIYQQVREIAFQDEVGAFFPSEHSYIDFLKRGHEELQPSRYLEIGVSTGQSLALAGTDTFAHGVDPEPHIVFPLHAWSKIFKLTSDDYFASGSTLRDFTFAFIDGLHTAEQTIRDIYNVIENSADECLILVHDVLPLNELVAKTDRQTSFWTGDVFRLVPTIYDQLSEQCSIAMILTAPSGLLAIRLTGELDVTDRLEPVDMSVKEFHNWLNETPIPKISNISELLEF